MNSFWNFLSRHHIKWEVDLLSCELTNSLNLVCHISRFWFAVSLSSQQTDAGLLDDVAALSFSSCVFFYAPLDIHTHYINHACTSSTTDYTDSHTSCCYILWFIFVDLNEHVFVIPLNLFCLSWPEQLWHVIRKPHAGRWRSFVCRDRHRWALQSARGFKHISADNRPSHVSLIALVPSLYTNGIYEATY